MKKYKIFSCLMLFITIFQSICFGSSIYVWSNNTDNTTQVNADANDNFLNIESESVILIEQTTRSSTL